MPSPTRIFKGLTLEELNTLKATALSRIANGDFTALAGNGHSSSKQYAMRPQDILDEVNAELEVLTGNPRVTRTTQDFSRLRVNNTTVNG